MAPRLAIAAVTVRMGMAIRPSSSSAAWRRIWLVSERTIIASTSRR
jgi:hypothetical protein